MKMELSRNLCLRILLTLANRTTHQLHTIKPSSAVNLRNGWRKWVQNSNYHPKNGWWRLYKRRLISTNHRQMCACEEAQRARTRGALQSSTYRKGFQVEVWCDFFETYSSALNMNSIRSMQAVLTAKTWHLDTATAFLNSDKHGIVQRHS